MIEPWYSIVQTGHSVKSHIFYVTQILCETNCSRFSRASKNCQLELQCFRADFFSNSKLKNVSKLAGFEMTQIT